MADSPNTPTEKPTLFLQLRAAIRVDHAVLNKAIFGKFPDCIPPKADDAYLYTAGMNVFGQIYFAIEECWDQLLEREDKKDENLLRYQEMLMRLKTDLLPRRQRLLNDLEYIERHILPAEAAPFLESLRTRGNVFKNRVTESIMANPPVLLAYAWVMYLALFNGGRWMAEELIAAGSKFWHREGDADTYSKDILSFWFFDDHSPKDNRQHGESIKADFCRHFDHAAELVREDEQDAVVAESRQLFRMCVEMVEFMDQQGLQAHLMALQGKNAGESHASISGSKGYLASWSTHITALWTTIAGQVS